MFVVEPSRKSFLEIDSNSHFPIQNLPYGVFRPQPTSEPRVGVAIGDFTLDLSVLEAEGMFSEILSADDPIFFRPSLNKFMTLGRNVWTQVRKRIAGLLDENNPKLRDDQPLRDRCLHLRSSTIQEMPIKVSEFTDFYSSYNHAFNVGSMIRGPENALMPNWKHLPVAYHGRGSSVIPSGVEIRRPRGQIKPPDSETPVFGSTGRLDFELEMGFVVGIGNDLSSPIPVEEALEHIFGLVLVNDWSARDIQVWEYKPLGPFLAKNFATSISPWVVVMDALEPVRVKNQDQEPTPLPYLQDRKGHTYNIDLFAHVKSERMETFQEVTHSNAKFLYWNIAQQLAHHTITGCNMQTGDLCGSGTISGPKDDQRACLLELTELGNKPLTLSSGEERIFLEDGDTVKLSGYSQGEGYRVGFGEVTTTILPAKQN